MFFENNLVTIETSILELNLTLPFIFKGTEHIFYKGEEVFRQNYIGGLILPK
jgi:hypothetical protein